VADPVQDDLSDRAFTVGVLVAGFVVNRAGEAGQRLLSGCGTAFKAERLGRRVWAGLERDRGIDLQGLVGRDVLNRQRRRRGRCRNGRGTGNLGRGMGGSGDRQCGDEAHQAEPQRLARVGAPQRYGALFDARRIAAEPVERANGSHSFSHRQ